MEKKMVVSVLEKFAASVGRPQERSSRSGETPQPTRARSAETGVALGVARAGVGLDVGLLDASADSEMALGLAHGGASKEESVSTYYNYILEIEKKRETKRDCGRT